MANSTFEKTLYDQIRYPLYARSQGVYARVYVGFIIDNDGHVQDATVLSPSTGDFRLEVVVRKALDKMPELDPAYRGKYVLPVVFSFKNPKEEPGYYDPSYKLPDDKLEGKTLLEEFLVLGNAPNRYVREAWDSSK